MTVGWHVDGTITIVDLYEDYYKDKCDNFISVECLFANFSIDYGLPINGIWRGCYLIFNNNYMDHYVFEQYSPLQKKMLKLVTNGSMVFNRRVFANDILKLYRNNYEEFVAHEELIKKCVRLSFVDRMDFSRYIGYDKIRLFEDDVYRYNKMADKFFIDTLNRHPFQKSVTQGTLSSGPSTSFPRVNIASTTLTSTLIVAPTQTIIPKPASVSKPLLTIDTKPLLTIIPEPLLTSMTKPSLTTIPEPLLVTIHKPFLATDFKPLIMTAPKPTPNQLVVTAPTPKSTSKPIIPTVTKVPPFSTDDMMRAQIAKEQYMSSTKKRSSSDMNNCDNIDTDELKYKKRKTVIVIHADDKTEEQLVEMGISYTIVCCNQPVFPM